MIVRDTGASVALEEAEDFTSLAFVVPRDAEAASDGRVAWDGGEHAAIAADALIELAGETADADWRVRFTEMVSYASSRGWVDEGDRVRMHIVRAG